jgi:hypothetical protein
MRGCTLQALGDIEEIDGRHCLVCPWHYSRVTLDTGEKYYQVACLDEDGGGKLVPSVWKRCFSNQLCRETGHITPEPLLAESLVAQLFFACVIGFL